MQLDPELLLKNDYISSPTCGIYLITPSYFMHDNFYERLKFTFEAIHSLNYDKNMHVLELRTYDETGYHLHKSAEKILKLCQDYKIVMVVHNKLDLAVNIGADGLFVDHGSINANKKVNLKVYRECLGELAIMGINCYDSKQLATKASEDADYVFFRYSKNHYKKPLNERESLSDLTAWWTTYADKLCAIHTNNNDGSYYALAKSGAHFLAFDSYVWENKSHIFNINKMIESVTTFNNVRVN